MDKMLYLDDVRDIPNGVYDLARSYDEAITYVQKHGIPSFISFDHDLGVDENNNLLPTGYDFAKWLVEMDMNKTHTFPANFSFHVHSANPTGRANIESYLNNYFAFKSKEQL